MDSVVNFADDLGKQLARLSFILFLDWFYIEKIEEAYSDWSVDQLCNLQQLFSLKRYKDVEFSLFQLSAKPCHTERTTDGPVRTTLSGHFSTAPNQQLVHIRICVQSLS